MTSDHTEPGPPASQSQQPSRFSRVAFFVPNVRQRLRWFGAEFLVVVTGVLVALALQAWYQNGQDRDRERNYLRQIMQDLGETERRIMRADSFYRRGDAGVTALLASFHGVQQPSPDSAAIWIWASRRYRLPAPVMETIEALVSTGDLRLIRSDSLRGAILGYAGEIRYLTWAQQLFVTRFSAGIDRMIGSVDLAAVRSIAGDYAELDEDARVSLFPSLSPSQAAAPGLGFDVHTLLRNQNAHAAIEMLADARTNLVIIRTRLMTPTRTLQRTIESAVARSNAPRE